MTTNSTLKSLKNKETFSSTYSSLNKWRNTFTPSSGVKQRLSDLDLAVNSTKSPVGDIKLTQPNIIPDYEEDLVKKKVLIEQDRLKDIIQFPSGDVRYLKLKKDPYVDWYTLYDIKVIKNINPLGRRNNELLSSNIEYFTINFNQDQYSGYFTSLPGFKPMEQTLVSHVFASEVQKDNDIQKMQSICISKKPDDLAKSGSLYMYPPLVDNNISTEKWVSSTKYKIRFVKLCQADGEKYYKFEYRKEENSEKCIGIIFLEFCSRLKQNNNMKGNLFELHIQEKIFILAGKDSKETEAWLTLLSQATGLDIEKDKPAKTTTLANFKRVPNVQESWTGSEFPILVEYGKESELSILKQRNETRFKVINLYTPLLSVNPPTTLESDPVCIQTDKFGKRILFEFMDVKLGVNFYEPYFLFLSLYDIKDGYKMSENFIFDPTDDTLRVSLQQISETFIPIHEIIKGVNDKLSEKFIRSCIFNISVPHDDIYIVLQVFKLYTSSLNNLWDLYTKSGNKYEAKLAKLFLDAKDSSKKYLMPVGFSFKRLFVRSELDDESKFQGLIKHETKYSSQEIIRFIQDYKNDPKLKSISISMDIDYRLSVMPDSCKNLSVLTTSYEGVKPFKIEDGPIAREVQDFTVSFKRFRGYNNPINLLYLTPTNLNLVNLKTTAKAKNFILLIEVYDEVKDTSIDPLPVIFAHTSKIALTRTACTAVICSALSSNMMDEFKILLPANYKPDLHILFTLYHVTYKEEDSKKKKNSEEVIGYSWVRLFEGQNVRENKEYGLPFSATLPQNYLSHDLEKLNDKSKGSADLKWIDGSGKCVLKFGLMFVSTYHTSNSYLAKIFNYVEESGITAETSVELCKFIKWLYSLETRIMIANLSSIMNLLFEILIQSNSFKVSAKEKCEDLQRNTLRLMLLIAGELCRRGRDDILRGYAKFQFNSQIPNNESYYHDIILSYLISCTGYGSDPVMTENYYLSCWYFLDVIYKSMASAAIQANRINANRKNFLREKTVENLEELIGLTVCIIKAKLNEDVLGTKILNRVLSKFLTKCFSIIDRGFVMKLISIVVENYPGLDPTMVSLKFDALVQLANYENFIQLNLPLESIASKNCTIDLITLSSKYCQNHFPLWLIFNKVKDVMEASSSIRKYGIRLVRNLIIKHHFDDRINLSEDKKTRVYMLYLPFLTMILDYWVLMDEAESKKGTEDSNLKLIDSNSQINLLDSDRLTMSRKKASMGTLDKKDSNFAPALTVNDDQPLEIDKKEFYIKEIKELLIIFIHILKSLDFNVILDWWKNLVSVNPKTSEASRLKVSSIYNSNQPKRYDNLIKFLMILKVCVRVFQYKESSFKNSTRRDKLLNPNAIAKALRSDLAYQHYTSYINLNCNEMDANLSTEMCLIVLDMIDKFQSAFKTPLEADSGNNDLIRALIELHLTMLRTKCSQMVRKHHFATLRQFLLRNTHALFKGSNNFCYNLCVEILRLSSSPLESVRNEARMFLYLILRSDFTFTGISYHRAYVQIIIASSKVVDERMSLSLLYESMEEVANMVKLDEGIKSSEFPGEVRDLTRRVKNILQLTYRFTELESDPESLVDAHCSIANSFSEAPELRQTWLDRIATLHTSHGNYSEAAMCYIHSAAIISQTLKRKNILVDGPLVFKSITPNITTNECSFREDALSDENKHSVEEFLSVLNSVAVSLYKAERFEIIAEVYKISLPFLEKNQDYKGLSEVYGLLKQAYDKIVESSGKRLLGTYYRISFYGRSFKEDHGNQYIYKEPKVTSLPEIVDRLRNIYEPKCKNLKIIMESNKVKWSELDQTRDYLQINAVKPNIILTANQQSAFYNHHNIGSFRLETPFTKSGKAHGSITDQCKRITVFTTLQTFPFIKKRIYITKSEVYELTPIQVAIDEMETQVKDLTTVVEQYPPDMKRLQLKLQGSVSVQVNAGPMAYAKNFLTQSEAVNHPKKYIETLENIFRDFLHICSLALDLNGRLIKEDQAEYHKGLMNQYSLMVKEMSEYLTPEVKPEQP